jgi:hypothetical protein
MLPMQVTLRADEGRSRQQHSRTMIEREEAGVKQVQIQRPQPKPAPQPIDLRTPSGKRLPF